MNKKTTRNTPRAPMAKSAPEALPPSDATVGDAIVDAAPPAPIAVAQVEAPAELPPTPPVTAPAPRSAKSDKATQEKFDRLTFSLSRGEARVLAEQKQSRQINGKTLKKGQLLRAALLALADIDDARLAQLVAQLPPAPTRGKKKGK